MSGQTYDICERCMFWRPVEDRFDETPYRGTCHRYPPMYTAPRDIDYQPKTLRYSWCGEFKQKE